LIFYTCVARFDMMKNLKKILELNKALNL